MAEQELWGEKKTLETAQALYGEWRELNDRIDEQSIVDRFATVRREAEEEGSIKGVRLSTPKMLDAVEQAHREDFDKNVQVDAKQLFGKEAELLAACDADAEAAMVLRPTQGYHSTTDRLLASIADDFKRSDLRAQASNRTLADFLKTYHASTDRDHASVVAFIEEESRNGWMSLNYKRTSTLDDVATMQAITAAVNERRAARVPLYVQEVRANLRARISDVRRAMFKSIVRGQIKPAMAHFKRTLTKGEVAVR